MSRVQPCELSFVPLFDDNDDKTKYLQPFPSGPVSIRPHTKARHGLVALEGYKGGAGPNLNQLRGKPAFAPSF